MKITKKQLQKVIKEAIDNQKEVCGNCNHWERAKPYKWGKCAVELPPWLEETADVNSPNIFPDDSMAAECPLFNIDTY